jgi:hypothetical protein
MLRSWDFIIKIIKKNFPGIKLILLVEWAQSRPQIRMAFKTQHRSASWTVGMYESFTNIIEYVDKIISVSPLFIEFTVFEPLSTVQSNILIHAKHASVFSYLKSI